MIPKNESLGLGGFKLRSLINTTARELANKGNDQQISGSLDANVQSHFKFLSKRAKQRLAETIVPEQKGERKISLNISSDSDESSDEEAQTQLMEKIS